MKWNLVADVGGTNCRLAMAHDGQLRQVQSSPTSDDSAVMESIARFIGQAGSRPQRVVVAAAGVVANGVVTLTNAGATRLSEAALAEHSSAGEAWIINDFEAAAWSLLTIASSDTEILQGPVELPSGNRLIIGPGTGLGVGALVWGQGQPAVVPGEGGHIGISPVSRDDAAVFEAYAQLAPAMQIGDSLRFEAEAFLSGTGLPDLYRAICAVQGVDARWRNGEQILRAAQVGDDQAASRTAVMFSEYLGRVAGDLTLPFSAFGGVYLTGGVALRNPWLFGARFLQTFNEGGRYTRLRSAIPVYLFTQEQFGLTGSMNAARYLTRH